MEKVGGMDGSGTTECTTNTSSKPYFDHDSMNAPTTITVTSSKKNHKSLLIKQEDRQTGIVSWKGFSLDADAHVLPATQVSFAVGLKIKTYINSTVAPMAALLFKGTVIGDPLAPSVASFSSRGPNTVSPGILKPDIIGPGVSILASWTTPLPGSTDTKSPFNMMSGTSMSCPHLSGVATLLKATHPYWTPAAIKSAIMTSTDLVNLKGTRIVDETLQPADLFSMGSGHVNPSKPMILD
ncbi:unnamed protein product [Lactuca virosa]|uniref:Peptidase S8/S53 domain-containing protein n=1 Tax=Lactuca virosa TaxID=75947 RepID=A0AAU9MIV3_9ASTR|nr:unnamed protein product [Lactuca virosa]